MENLTAFGLNEVSLLDNILLEISPMELQFIRCTCILFMERIHYLIPYLYRKWGVEKSIEDIRSETSAWKFESLVRCSLTYYPDTLSFQYGMLDRLCIYALKHGYSEAKCISYYRDVHLDRGNFTYHNEVKFLAWKRGYKILLNLCPFSLVEDSIYKSYFEKSELRLSVNVIDKVEQFIEQIQFNPHVSIEDYAGIISTCVSYIDVMKVDLIRGLEASVYDELDANYLYIAGYFLGCYLPELDLFTANLPKKKAPYKFLNHTAMKFWTDEDIGDIKLTPFSLLPLSLALYRPDLYVKRLPKLSQNYNKQILDPYYKEMLYYMN